MTRIAALVRAHWLIAASYRLQMFFSFMGVVVSFIPLYFVANALQPVVEQSIRHEGETYFGFLVIGIIMTSFLSFALHSVPRVISNGIASGTLEALFATPTRLPTLLVGSVSYEFLWLAARSLPLLALMAVLGVPVAWTNLPLAFFILIGIILAYAGVGLAAAALHLVFRTSGPLLTAVIIGSSLLGGVYYSTTVIPSVVQPLASVVPLTYGLRALRRSLLTGEPFIGIASDLLMTLAFAAALLAIGIVAFVKGFDYARRAGTLAQY